MLFDYQAFKEELRANPSKKHIIEKWEKVSKATQIIEEPFYDYLNKFEPFAYKVPQELKDDFDWELLLKLVYASFSSDCSFIVPELYDSDEITEQLLLPELSICVSSGNQGVKKLVSELWSFQILRLYEIYCEEQINLHLLKLEDQNEKNVIESEREIKVCAYNIKRNNAVTKIERQKCFLL